MYERFWDIIKSNFVDEFPFFALTDELAIAIVSIFIWNYQEFAIVLLLRNYERIS